MIIATEDALDRFPRVLIKLAQTHKFNWLQRAIYLQLPAMLPNLLGGMKLVVAYSFIGVIGSEFLMAAAGVGYQISYSYNEFNVPRMYGLMLLVVILVALANLLLSVPERRFASRALGRRG
jgi:NitT/TauT family transport system permease protein